MQVEQLVANEGQATEHQIHLYQQKVGSITYATTISRPDASRATQKLAEFLQNPSPHHQDAADRVIAYLYGTRTYALQYGFSDDPETPLFRSASDAAFADNASRQSTDLFGGAVDWKCVNQRTVTTSTTEAELLSLSHNASWMIWWKRFLSAIDLDTNQEYSIDCDNLQTVRLMLQESPKLVTKLKHVDIHQHWLRQELAKGTINVQWVPTADMTADGFTKALPPQKHTNFVKHLNLVDIKALLTNHQT